MLPPSRPSGRPAALRSPQRLGQIALGVIWCVDALLKTQSYFFHNFAMGVIDASAAGQPKLLGDPITFIGNHIVAPHQATFTVFVVLVEFSIGACLITSRFVKPALLISFAWALGVWYTGEGLGFIFTSTTPSPLTGIIATSPLYVIAGLLVWPRDSGAQLGLLGERGARLVWAALWLGAAVLWLFPSNAGANALHDAFAGAPSGTGWLASVESTAANAVAGSGVALAIALALASAAIGLAVLWGRGTRVALYGAIVISLVFWVLAEGLGALFTGAATDIGTGPLMVLIASQLLVLAPRRATAVNRPQVQTASLA
jgi:hypothetical protein